MLPAISATWAGLWVRAFRAYGINRSSGQYSICKRSAAASVIVVLWSVISQAFPFQFSHSATPPPGISRRFFERSAVDLTHLFASISANLFFEIAALKKIFPGFCVKKCVPNPPVRPLPLQSFTAPPGSRIGQCAPHHTRPSFDVDAELPSRSLASVSSRANSSFIR